MRPRVTLQGGGWHLDGTNVRDLWKVVNNKQLPIVAVIDGGFDFDHQSLGGRLRPDTTFFSLTGQLPDAGMLEDATTPVMHGTQVASILTGDNADASPPFVPVAPNVHVIGVVVGHYEGGGITYQEHEIAIGIYRAIAANARIINMSLALESEDLLSYFALLHAEELGVLVVASTGNYDLTGGPDGPDIAYPARHPTVLAVGGHDKSDFWATWSDGKRAACWQGGHGVDLAGPAVDIRTLPENTESPGTSFAAPIVSGIAALLHAEFPFATPYHLRQALMKGADPPKEQPHPERLGHGCVNAVAARDELELIAPTKPGETPMLLFRNFDVHSFITGLTLGLVLGGSAIGAWKKGGTPGDLLHPVPTIHGDVMQLSGSGCINPEAISTELTIDLHESPGAPGIATPVATDTVSSTDDHYEFKYVTAGTTYTVSINGALGTVEGCPHEASVKATKGTVTKHLYNP